AHGSPLGADEIKATREKLGWQPAAFDVPAPILAAWRAAGSRSHGAHQAWGKTWSKLDAEKRASFEDATNKESRVVLERAIADAKTAFAADTAKRATRNWSELTLDRLTPVLPALIGGSADLTGSNNTKAKGQAVITKDSFAGSYIH